MEEYLKSLYITNPLLKKNTKRYIWGNDKNASELFVHLCELGIKVDGFICDEYKGTILWNKPVAAYTDIEDCDDVTICIPEKELNYEMPVGSYKVCRRTECLNPEFTRKQAVIYGAGMIGRHVLDFLRNENIDVLCFVDSDKKIVGKEIDGTLVEDISYLENLPDTAYLVEAGKYYKEIDAAVTRYIGLNKRFFWEKVNRNCKEIMIDKMRGIGLKELVYLEQLGKDRKFYLYGDHDLSHKYKVVLELLGFQVDEVKDKIDNELDKCVADLLYEENYLILLGGAGRRNWHLK